MYFTNEIIEHLKPKKVKSKTIPRKQIPITSIKPKKPLQQPKKIIKVPKTKLPSHLQYLKPSANKSAELELGKINLLLKDPMVKEIECNGPDQHILVRGVMGTKETNIVLTKEEIDQIIKTFSDAAKIPVHEGLFKVVVGRFVFSSIVSNITGSKFIINKMNYNPNFKI